MFLIIKNKKTGEITKPDTVQDLIDRGDWYVVKYRDPRNTNICVLHKDVYEILGRAD